MLNPKLKLNTKVWNVDVEKKSTRLGFGEGLLIAGTQNENIVGLCADLVESTKMNLFADKFPDRFIELGIAEQNLASVASGMASMGKIPFIASYAIYSPGRNWEQIRTTICFNGELPNIVVISPCDAIEAKKATIAMSKIKSPTYLRCARNDTSIITTEETPFEIGKAQIIFQPENGLASLGIIATGPSVYNALIVAKNLESEGIKVKVMNLSTIKPLDSDAIIALAKETKKIVTVEDHQISGGMGGAVAECLSQNYPTRIEFIGVKDKFGQSGNPEELAKYYEIDQEAIFRAVRKILSN